MADIPIVTITKSSPTSSLTQYTIRPSRTSVSGVSFQTSYNGNLIFIPVAGTRRKIANLGEIEARELFFEEGYDSDDNLGQFYDTVGADDNLEDYEEDPCIDLGETILPPDAPHTVRNIRTTPTGDDTSPTNEDITPTNTMTI